MLGKVVFERYGISDLQIEINLSKLKNGVYYLSIENEYGININRRILKIN
jgi:hypothetical protein